jgi:hypothetical protein
MKMSYFIQKCSDNDIDANTCPSKKLKLGKNEERKRRGLLERR